MSKFFRKGEVGDWKDYFSGEKLQNWDEWIQKNLQGTEIKITFEWNIVFTDYKMFGLAKYWSKPSLNV